ncbi:sensor histidine kinase [Pseudomonas ficuserectae]|uniref:histidine kinase n=2 Tax=Pseudomonas amygdali pv. lachrymans TaxID=53707 RepID=A0AB37R8Z7_PSEAV|nr:MULTISPECIES: HAMP domain-containing sensor histidine kinase [Pseudomonas syringae group]KKY58433.1 ATPase [Pseudomonas amygdali pv. lachrymans]KPB97573.1 Sensor histidine kinase [Pseudomonas amygdali pv. lachrymans]KPC18884.1 Sensor histidine kinase [Pseudomonas amygdali pv. lachrymans]MDU8609348.1 HAMP domain-containing sensor histidine kinase [Pseudomonas syringae group sp. 247E2]QWA48048.1 HAMP domain-containing histidine kinase [Pseudomonas amygdali pv. lachrymans]
MINLPGRRGSLHRLISAILLGFGLLMTIGLTTQAFMSQELVDHPIWKELLETATNNALENSLQPAPQKAGRIQVWRLSGETPAPGMPPLLASLAPGFYNEGDMDRRASSFTDPDYAVLVTSLGNERLVAAIDISDLEQEQNLIALIGGIFLIMNLILIIAVIAWLYVRLHRPVQALALGMKQLDPESLSQRLPVQYDQEELKDIACGINAHLERVEQFMARERALLDQASHEFRTPIAVISGALDVLARQALPACAAPPIQRMRATVDNLTEIMVALLYLSREPMSSAPDDPVELDRLLPGLVKDHQHLLDGKPVQFSVHIHQTLCLQVPEAMLRIAIGNLLRNAAENTYDGTITVRLKDGVLSVTDSGEGFDTAQASLHYLSLLRNSTRAGTGKGLGLFLVRRICERFRWTLTLESMPTLGTRAELDFRTQTAQQA